MTMNMTNIRKFHQDTLDALDVLIKNFRSQEPKPEDSEPNKVKIDIYVSEFNSDVKAEAFFDIIHALRKHGIDLKEHDKYEVQQEVYENDARTTICAVVTLPKNFEEEYQKLCQEYGEQPDAAPKTKTKTGSGTDTLYLNAVGDLYRDPKSKYCYPMEENSGRHRIVGYLVDNKGYQKTADISAALDGKNEQSIRTEIGKIRSNIKKLLKIDGKRVIDGGRKESGYRINPNCKVIRP